MTVAMQLLCRVVRRRLQKGDCLEDILRDYGKLTEAETLQLKAVFLDK